MIIAGRTKCASMTSFRKWGFAEMVPNKRGCFVQGCAGLAGGFAVLIAGFFGILALDGKSPAAVFSEIGRVGVVEYITKLFGEDPIANQAQVAGIYCHLVPAQQDPGGAAIPEQYWAYAFLNDGNFTTYLEGYEQFGGTWSQSGNQITVNVDAIPDLSAAYTWYGTVSADATTIDTGEFVLEASDAVCKTGN